jgi:hypothetical protein
VVEFAVVLLVFMVCCCYVVMLTDLGHKLFDFRRNFYRVHNIFAHLRA